MTYFEPSKHLDKVYRSEYKDIIMCDKVTQLTFRSFNNLVERVDVYASVHKDPAETLALFIKYMLIDYKDTSLTND